MQDDKMSMKDDDNRNEFEPYLNKQVEITQYKGSPIIIKGTLLDIETRFHNLKIKTEYGDLVVIRIGNVAGYRVHSFFNSPSEELPTDSKGNHIKESLADALIKK